MLGKFINSVLAAPSSDRLQTIASRAEYNTAKTLVPAVIIANIITYVLGFVGLVFLVMILYSGAQMIFAGGESEKIEQAKSRLKNAVLGFAVVSLAFTVLVFIRATVLNVL